MSEILKIDVNDYSLQSMKASGGVQPTYESKDVTITQNGTTTITPSTGYDALSDVDVTVNVPVPATYPPNWSQIGYSNTPDIITNDFSVAKGVYDNWDSSRTDLSSMFNSTNKIAYMPLVDTSNATNMSYMFAGNDELVYVPLINTSKVTNMTYMFQNATNLKTLPLLDTKNVTNMSYMFYCSVGATKLTEIPQFNTEKVTTMQNAFGNCAKLVTVPQLNTSRLSAIGLWSTFQFCSSLSNESLNNILAMCINATNVSTKTLKYIGLNSTQATTCQSLSNWDAFVEAGWSTGF